MSEADLRLYYGRKRALALWSALAAIVAMAAVAPLSFAGAQALGLGIGCGLLNALLTMRGGERLLDHHSVGAFVLSSSLRIVVFAIVPVEFALHAPWWTMVVYFVGFFLPLALYTVIVARAFRTN